MQSYLQHTVIFKFNISLNKIYCVKKIDDTVLLNSYRLTLDMIRCPTASEYNSCMGYYIPTPTLSGLSYTVGAPSFLIRHF